MCKAHIGSAAQWYTAIFKILSASDALRAFFIVTPVGLPEKYF